MAEIVIIGGGFAGYSALKTLHKLGVTDKHNVLLVDPSPKFVYLPSLPYLLTRKKREEEISEPFSRIAERLGAQYLKDAVASVDAEKHVIALGEGEEIGYDKLIVTAGAKPEYYGIKGAESALPAWRLGHYYRILEKIEEGAGSAIVVGGGLTGIEVAGELLEILGPGNVTLVEKMNLLLPALRHEKASRLAREFLEEKGVRIILGRGVAEVEKGRRVILEDGETLEADLVVWTVGIRAMEIPFTPPPQRSRRGWLLVDEFMRVRGLRDVYAAGDIASVKVDDAYACKMAEEAILQGRVAARNVAAEISGEKPVAVHRPIFRSDRARTLFSMGFNRGVMVWDKIVHRGRLPFTAKMLIEKVVMSDIKGRPLGGVLSELEILFIKTLDKVLG